MKSISPSSSINQIQIENELVQDQSNHQDQLRRIESNENSKKLIKNSLIFKVDKTSPNSKLIPFKSNQKKLNHIKVLNRIPSRLKHQKTETKKIFKENLFWYKQQLQHQQQTNQQQQENLQDINNHKQKKLNKNLITSILSSKKSQLHSIKNDLISLKQDLTLSSGDLPSPKSDSWFKNEVSNSSSASMSSSNSFSSNDKKLIIKKRLNSLNKKINLFIPHLDHPQIKPSSSSNLIHSSKKIKSINQSTSFENLHSCALDSSQSNSVKGKSKDSSPSLANSNQPLTQPQAQLDQSFNKTHSEINPPQLSIITKNLANQNFLSPSTEESIVTDVLIEQQGGFCLLSKILFTERLRNSPWKTVKLIRHYDHPGHWDAHYVEGSSQIKSVPTPHSTQTFLLPTSDWNWLTDFMIDKKLKSVDCNGWEYYNIFTRKWQPRPRCGATFIRRRRWIRVRAKSQRLCREITEQRSFKFWILDIKKRAPDIIKRIQLN
ncbi:hypothetical protein O181_051923 [Austropuccinia psidii MF-1]|uniref:Peroxin/Ferlin domain-containing protein n=1 Tax=Austropuccinia psidii MF-1 TaxID=1389203 RepID=A0A9Q3E1Q5_9BASI|nr:hypothetical protein [Austropuccinia psidii MF-1]